MEASPTPTRAERPSLAWPAACLAALLVVFGFRSLGGEALDVAFQSLFRTDSGWAVSRDVAFASAPGNWLAYNGPKVALVLVALWLVAVAIRPALGPAALGRRRALYLLACLALVPVVCTQLRAATRMTTPADVTLYGGRWEHRLLFEAKPEGYPSRAFPAGHASGGFALLGLAYAWGAARARQLGALAGLLAGGGMGLYQIARGEHFLSHTLVTAALAWLICAGLARWMTPARSAP